MKTSHQGTNNVGSVERGVSKSSDVCMHQRLVVLCMKTIKLKRTASPSCREGSIRATSQNAGSRAGNVWVIETPHGKAVVLSLPALGLELWSDFSIERRKRGRNLCLLELTSSAVTVITLLLFFIIEMKNMFSVLHLLTVLLERGLLISN